MSNTQSIASRLAALNDAQIADFFAHWGTALVDGARTDLETMRAAVPAEVRGEPGFERVSDVMLEGDVDPSTAAQVARTVLMPLSDDPEMSPTIATALDTFDDDKQMVGTILALGLVASVMLIISTTEFDGRIGGVTFHKGKADPETIKAVTGGVFGLLSPFLDR